jgi:hypothetical protein
MIASSPALMPPTAHMSLRDRALAQAMLPPLPVTFVQRLPCRCQVPTPGKAPLPPNTQTSEGPNAVTPVISRVSPDSRNFLATDHEEPFQWST